MSIVKVWIRGYGLSIHWVLVYKRVSDQLTHLCNPEKVMAYQPHFRWDRSNVSVHTVRYLLGYVSGIALVLWTRAVSLFERFAEECAFIYRNHLTLYVFQIHMIRSEYLRWLWYQMKPSLDWAMYVIFIECALSEIWQNLWGRNKATTRYICV